ncbi:hypothetical protein ACS6FU_11740, partial [Stutzerimonas frequens]
LRSQAWRAQPGAGLAVAQAVARAHRGGLQLRSRPGRGTCALLTLPLLPRVGTE